MWLFQSRLFWAAVAAAATSLLRADVIDQRAILEAVAILLGGVLVKGGERFVQSRKK